MHAYAFAGNYTWNGTTNNQWGTASNWSGGIVPGANDTITINSGKPNLELDQDRTVNRLVLNGSTIDLDTNELYVTQRASFNGGDVIGESLKLRGTYVYFQGTDFNCTLDVVAGQIKFSGGTFNQTGTFEQNGGASGWGAGGCVFNDSVTIKNTGATYLRMGETTGDIFNDKVTFISAGVYALQLSYGDTSWYNGNVFINCTGNGGLSFCAGTNAAAIIGAGKTLSAGSSGLTAGVITLKNILQSDTTTQSLITTGTGTLSMQGCSFTGAITVSSPSLLVKTSTFYNAATFTKTGNATNHWEGGNVFYGTTTINNNTTGSGILRMALQVGDVYSGDVTFNTGTGYIQVAFADTSTFGGDVTTNNSKVGFSSGSGLLQFNGGEDQVLTTAAIISAQKFILTKPGGLLTTNRQITIDSVLTLSGGILSTDSLITLKAPAIVSGGSNLSHIDGPVKKIGNTAFVFPVGDYGHYYPLTITAPSNSTDAFSCRYIFGYHNESDSTDTTLAYISKCAYWELDRVTGSSNVKVTLSWDSLGCSIFDTAGVTIANWDGTRWRNLGNAGIDGDPYIGSMTSVLDVISYRKLGWAFPPSALIIPTLGLPRTMEEDFFGYNGNNTIASDNTGEPLQSWWKLADNNRLAANSITLMRLPAGTLSNYSDWRTGYPIIERDLPYDWFYDRNAYRLPMNRTENEYTDVRANLEMMAARPIIAWNMMTSGYEYELASIYRLQELNLPIRYIELGNEFYLNDEHYLEKFTSVTDYVQMATQWADDFRALGLPQTGDAKIAIIGAKSNENSAGRRRLWLDQVLNRLGNNDNIDAITIHDYIFEGAAQGNCTGTVSTSVNNGEKFLSLAFSNGDLLKEEEFMKIQNFNAANPGDKLEIWMTEYNLDDDTDLRTGTWLHGLLNAAMTLKYLETPDVTMAISHTMISDAKYGNIFESTDAFDGVNCHGTLSGNPTVTGDFSAVGTSLNIVAQAMRHAVAATPIIFPNTGTLQTTNYPDIYGWLFEDIDGNEKVIVLNLSSHPKEMDFFTTATTSIFNLANPQSAFSAKVVDAINLQFAIIGNPTSNYLSTLVDRLYLNGNPWKTATSIEMPPYSMLLMERNDTSNSYYNVRLTDDEICTGTTTTLVVESNDLGNISPACSSCTGAITFSTPVTTGNRAVYTVTGVNGSSTPYTIQLCSTCSASTVLLTVHENISDLTISTSSPHSISNDVINYCYNDDPIELTASFTAGSGGSISSNSYLWAPAIDSGLVSSLCSGNTPICSTITVEPARSTLYTVYVNDGQCWQSKSVFVNIPVAPFDLGEDITVCEGTVVEITADYIDPDPVTDPVFSGTNGATLPTLTVTPPTTGDHPYTITVNDDGCAFEESVTVHVLECCSSSIAPSNHLGLYYSHGEDIENAFAAVCTTAGCSAITVSAPGNNNTGSLQLIGDPANRPTFRIDGEFRITGDVRDPLNNSNLVVDGFDLTIENCNIEFGEDAWINVMHNRILTLENCSITTCGPNMWKGIVLDKKGERNPPEIILRDCFIENAQFALYLTREAIFTLENCTFHNNYIDAKFENYLRGISNGMQSDGQYSISGCTFTSDGNLLMAPYDAEFKLTAFDLKDVERVRIGVPGGAPNIIENSTFGIKMENSGAEVWNNEFDDISKNINSTFWGDGSAIFLSNDNNLLDRSLQVGLEGVNPSNSFTKAEFGIIGFGECNYKIYNNRFGHASNGPSDAIENICIGLINTQVNSIDIDDHNLFYDYKQGIEIFDVNNAASVSITNNDFFNASLTTGANFEGTAILVNSQIPITRINHGLIQANQIGTETGTSQPRIGIHLGNVGGFRIQNNDLYFHEDATPAFNFRGIRLENAPECELSGNQISNDSYNSGAGNALLGIRVDASSMPLIKCNGIENMGHAMQFANNNDYVTLIENGMSEYDLGILLGDGTFPTFIGDFQAAPGIGLDNVWNQDASDRVEGDLNLLLPMPWYHHGNELFSNNFAPVRSDNFWSGAIVPVGFQTGYLDQACYYIGQGTLRSIGYSSIAADTARYEGDYANEYLYLRKESAYKFMIADTGRITMGREDDEDFQNLYEVLSSSNIGKLDSVIKYCSKQEWSEANALLETIEDTNDHQTYLEQVLSILIDAALEERVIDNGDTIDLLEIAYLHSLEGGQAVKIARAALHLEIEDVGGESRLYNTNQKETIPDLKLWPNPTNDVLQINRVEPVHFRIYDSGMRMILSGTNRDGTIETDKLQAGFYFLFVTENAIVHKPLTFCIAK